MYDSTGLLKYLDISLYFQLLEKLFWLKKEGFWKILSIHFN